MIARLLLQLVSQPVHYHWYVGNRAQTAKPQRPPI